MGRFKYDHTKRLITLTSDNIKRLSRKLVQLLSDFRLKISCWLKLIIRKDIESNVVDVSNPYVDLNPLTEASKISFVDISKSGFVDVSNKLSVDELTNFDEQPRQQRHSQEFIATSKIVVETSTNNVDNKSTPELRKKQNDYSTGFNSCRPSCLTDFNLQMTSLIIVIGFGHFKSS